MARTNFTFIALVGLSLGTAACAPSPLYVSPGLGTVGEIPRDGRGEPLWSAIRPAPASPANAVMPVTGGIPIIPPPGYPPQP